MSIWQAKTWGDLLVSSDQVEKIIEIDWLQVEKRSIWLWQYGLFILWIEKDVHDDVLSKIEEVCKNESCIFFQIETVNYRWKIIKVGWKKWYYKKFITPYTAIIDLEKSEEEILANMKPKWRYNIKLAAKKWVEVKSVEKTQENIKVFYSLMFQTTSRDKFNGNKIEYYIDFLNKLDNSQLLVAYAECQTPIAAGIFIFAAEVSIYYYWASTSDKKYRNLMAPYLLQWEAIQVAKKSGSQIYDFLWVASPGEKNSPLSWVTDFKKKLTKDVREVSTSYIWINKRFIYTMLDLLRKIKNFIK